MTVTQISRVVPFFLIISVLYAAGCAAFTNTKPNDLGNTSKRRIIEQFIADMPIVHVEVLIARVIRGKSSYG